MKHDWEEISLVTPDNPWADMNHFGARKCRNCGSVQQKNQQFSWARVTGHRWEPLAGRCKGKSDTVAQTPVESIRK